MFQGQTEQSIISCGQNEQWIILVDKMKESQNQAQSKKFYSAKSDFNLKDVIEIGGKKVCVICHVFMLLDSDVIWNTMYLV